MAALRRLSTLLSFLQLAWPWPSLAVAADSCTPTHSALWWVQHSGAAWICGDRQRHPSNSTASLTLGPKRLVVASEPRVLGSEI